MIAYVCCALTVILTATVFFCLGILYKKSEYDTIKKRLMEHLDYLEKAIADNKLTPEEISGIKKRIYEIVLNTDIEDPNEID